MRNYTRELHLLLLLSPVHTFIHQMKKVRFVFTAIAYLISFFFYTIVVIGILTLYHCAYVTHDHYCHISFRNKLTGTHTVCSFPIISDKIIVVNPDKSIQIGSPSRLCLKTHNI